MSRKPVGKKMGISDPIADALTRIRNASRAKHKKVDLAASILIEEILKVLKGAGYINTYKRISGRSQDTLRVYLKFTAENRSAIKEIRRISKPGLRIYAKRDKVPKVLGGLGVAILSTSKGILTDEGARRLGVGGEVVCYVW